jgi:hypothetical protein
MVGGANMVLPEQAQLLSLAASMELHCASLQIIWANQEN